MAELRNPKRNNWSTLADVLTAAKQKANKYEVKDWVPLLGGTGLGDMFLGDAPELIDDASYHGNQAFVSGGNAATGGIGTFGADPRTLDVAMLGADAFGVGSLATYGAKTGARKAYEEATKGTLNPMRRKFMKGAAATAGVAAIGGLAGLKKAGKETAEQVAKKTGDNITKTAAKPKYKYNSLKEYNEDLMGRAMDESDIASWERDGRPALDYGDSYEDDILKWKKHLADMDEQAYSRAKESATEGIYARPDGSFADRYGNRVSEYDMKRLDWFSPEAKAEMKMFKNDSTMAGFPEKNKWDYLDYWSGVSDDLPY